ncbi:hypothetical protein [Haladaptatus halobius]|uniref:hypothetical protein n=1 Tax=Haladaptatus halobius TaxID=2884875 RepID=UPI001D09A863|nr:hypothetical protein [Haladaptatus halobius]
MTTALRQEAIREIISRTVLAVHATLRRHDGQLVFAVVTMGYLAVYLFAIGHLASGNGQTSLLIVEDPIARANQPVGTLTWEPVARLDFWIITLLISPLNVFLGLGLALLVGLNLSVTYLAWTQPKACGLKTTSSGIVAAFPALLSGAACCGPVLLIVLGIQASGVLLTVFSALVPLAVVLLVGSLLFVGRKVDPTLL